MAENKKRVAIEYDQALKASTEYFGGDNLAASVFISKYALKDSDGIMYESSPYDMHERLAVEFARIESNYENGLTKEEILESIVDFKYVVPQGGSMSGVGNDLQVSSLSNCFVIGNGSDSYGGIHKVDEQQTQLMKRRM